MKYFDKHFAAVLLELLTATLLLAVVLVFVAYIHESKLTAHPAGTLSKGSEPLRRLPTKPTAGSHEKSVTYPEAGVSANKAIEEKSLPANEEASAAFWSIKSLQTEVDTLGKKVEDLLARGEKQLPPMVADQGRKMEPVLDQLRRDDANLHEKLEMVTDRLTSVEERIDRLSTLQQEGRSRGSSSVDQDGSKDDRRFPEPRPKAKHPPNPDHRSQVSPPPAAMEAPTTDRKTGLPPFEPLRLVPLEKRTGGPEGVALRKYSSGALLKDIKKYLLENGHEPMQIDAGAGRLLMPTVLNFERGSFLLSKGKLVGIARLADALAVIVPCYLHGTTKVVKKQCSGGGGPDRLSMILVEGHASGAHVGTARFQYNWKLAMTRAILTLQTILEIRPDLLNFANSQGGPLFKGVGLVDPGGRRGDSRRVSLRFVMDSTDVPGGEL